MGYNSKVKIENNYELFTIFWSFHFSYVLLHHSNGKCCCCSSVVEHFLGKEEVTSSILVNSSQSKDYVSRNPFFISAERPEGRQGTGGADGSGPPAAEMPNAKDAGREGALAAETPNAEMHAGVRRPPRRRVPCGSLRKGQPLQADEKRQNKQSEDRLPPIQPILRPKWTIQADRLP